MWYLVSLVVRPATFSELKTLKAKQCKVLNIVFIRFKLSLLSYSTRDLLLKIFSFDFEVFQLLISYFQPLIYQFSLERRWSSRTFRYGYLVTTSPQSSAPPSATSSLRLDYWLRVLQTLMVWRAVCTRPGNVFTAVCWPAITSDSDFMQASCSLQSELRPAFWDLLHLTALLPSVPAIVARV